MDAGPTFFRGIEKVGWERLDKQTPHIVFSEWAKGPCFACKRPLSQFTSVWEYRFEGEADQALARKYEEFLGQRPPELVFCPDCKNLDRSIRYHVKKAYQEWRHGPIPRNEYKDM